MFDMKCCDFPESLAHSWSDFNRPCTPGKVYHCSIFSPFVDKWSQCGSLGVLEPYSDIFFDLFRVRHHVLTFEIL